MRRIVSAFVAGAALALAGPAMGDVYTDATGENHDGNAHMDITSVEVTSTASTIKFTINFNGSIANPNDWGKYGVGISTSNSTGDTSTSGNGWGRQISMADGMDAWVGSWVDGGGGAQAWTYDGSSWGQNSQVGVTLGTQSTMFTFNLSDLGLSAGQTIQFDVYTTGNNSPNGANDSAANPNQASPGWDDPYQTPTGEGLSYTIVPEPGSLALMGLGGLMMLRRRSA